MMCALHRPCAIPFHPQSTALLRTLTLRLGILHSGFGRVYKPPPPLPPAIANFLYPSSNLIKT